jgi:hypothetical protein
VSSMKKIFIFVMALLLMPFMVNATVIFSDNFDDQPDWNGSQSYALLSKWTGSLCNTDRGGSFPYVGYIDNKNFYGASGKGFTQYWDAISGEYAQDCWLTAGNLSWSQYNNIYMGYHFKIDSNWQWGSANRLKLGKIHFSDDSTWDFGYWADWCAYCGTGNCYPPSGAGFTICTDEAGLNAYGNWNALTKGVWHSFVWNFNLGTGVLTLKIDGVDAANTSFSTAFPTTAFDNAYGASMFGNVSGTGIGVEAYTAWDNFIIATTEAEVTSFLGSGTTTVPTVTGCTLSGASMQ